MKRLWLVLVLAIAVALALPVTASALEPIPLDGTVTEVDADVPLVVPAGWVAGSRGLAMSAQNFLQWHFTITKHTASGDVVVASCDYDESDAYWMPGVEGPMTSDDVGFYLAPFNTKIGAKAYFKSWMYFMDAGLPAGSYTFQGGVYQTRDAFDLLYIDGTKYPQKIPAGPLELDAWDFTVD